MPELKERLALVGTQIMNTVQKAVTDQASRVEVAIGEMSKLHAESISQAGHLMSSMVHLAGDQIAFLQQLAGEWRKLILAATRSATDAFTSRQV